MALAGREAEVYARNYLLSARATTLPKREKGRQAPVGG